jgi:beta-glucosidase
MAIPTGLLLLGMLFLMFSFASAQIEMPRDITEDFDTTCITDLKFGLSRKSFPGDFIFGAAASAYQV